MDKQIDIKKLSAFSGFDEHVKHVMGEWNVHGTAIAIIKDGEVIHSRGYGWRDFEQQLPVDSETLFAIGSASKAFTATALGILVDRGLLEWDQPVRKYLPHFHLMDAFADERITPRDLLCHHSGLPGHNMMWFGSPANRKELVERLAYLQPNRDFRTTFQYQNMMFVVAGFLVEALTGLTWEAFVQAEIFDRLGMSSSNFSVEVSSNSGNVALPYRLEDNQPVRVPFANIDVVGPAGSINSNLDDMVQWVRLQLEHGKAPNGQVISAENLEQIHTSTSRVPDDFFGPLGQYPDLCFESYGLGWFIQRFHGQRLIHHGGHIDGYGAFISFMPELNAGVVFLANDNRTFYVLPLSLNIYELLMGYKPEPWSSRVLDCLNQGEKIKTQNQDAALLARKTGTAPSHPLAEYTGEYAHPGYGSLQILQQAAQLAIRYNSQVFPLEHFHYDVFSGTYEEEGVPKWVRILFHSNVDGKIDSVSIPFEPAVEAICFRRQP